jgi:hypothetical protein
MAFVLSPQGPELLDVLRRQGVATAHVIDHPGHRTDKAKTQHGQE